ATQQLIHRLPADLPQQIPKGEIHGRNRIQNDALAAVEQRPVVHLVPHQLEVADGAPLDESREVLLHDVGTDISPGAHAKAESSVAGLDLDDQRAEHIDSEALATLAILRVLAHRS